MKKFACVFFFLIVSMNCFSHTWDTTSVVKFNLNPAVLLSGELGGMFEYRILKYLSIEAGGGVHAGYSLKNNQYLYFVNGYTIRVAPRFYTKPGFYVSPLFFYRYKFGSVSNVRMEG